MIIYSTFLMIINLPRNEILPPSHIHVFRATPVVKQEKARVSELFHLVSIYSPFYNRLVSNHKTTWLILVRIRFLRSFDSETKP